MSILRASFIFFRSCVEAKEKAAPKYSPFNGRWSRAHLFTATRSLGAGKTSIFQQLAFAGRILLT